ncbi:unnamed protein product [Notodromas monacha]|uniref:Glucose dehydrogenase n=1 Tax=Notodromas monacha TaxID=399045 RepID=A0A7R9BMZ3_9CRUS|nr:unnamed protein product [Notodromas monacha]CAG0917100.1 unnamed protein product [Notodromas monacha]
MAKSGLPVHFPEIAVVSFSRLMTGFDWKAPGCPQFPSGIFGNAWALVGAGSSGSVVASRLSENPDWKVLLIEAGGDETEISDVPALAGYLQLGRLDWQFKTEPQPTACLAMKHWEPKLKSSRDVFTVWSRRIKFSVGEKLVSTEGRLLNANQQSVDECERPFDQKKENTS